MTRLLKGRRRVDRHGDRLPVRRRSYDLRSETQAGFRNTRRAKARIGSRSRSVGRTDSRSRRRWSGDLRNCYFRRAYEARQSQEFQADAQIFQARANIQLEAAKAVMGERTSQAAVARAILLRSLFPNILPDEFVEEAACFGEFATIVGGSANDHLVGTSDDDVIVGLDGDDKIEGRGGDDVLCGGPGDDQLLGQSGDDQLAGGLGRDYLSGGPGSDRIIGVDTMSAPPGENP